MASFRDQYSIRQGAISLYRRTNQGTGYQSDSWYTAIKLPGQKLIRRSLKTTDQKEAELAAEDLYFDLREKHKRGLSLNAKSFESMAKLYIKEYAANLEHEKLHSPKQRHYSDSALRNKTLIINKYLIPFFAGKSLQDITDHDVEAYKDFRKTYWITGEGSHQDYITYIRDGRKVRRPRNTNEKSQPSYGTVNKELTVIRQVYDLARARRVIGPHEIPTIQNVRRPRISVTKNPALTVSEVKKLLHSVVLTYKNATNYKHKRHHKLILHYISFMCLTGLRVTEAKKLRVSDCETIEKEGKQYLKISVSGKGKHRELIGLEESAVTFRKIQIMHRENAEFYGWDYHDKMNMFVDQYGRYVNSFSRGIDAALERAQLLHDSHGNKRSAGSFRKYYITQALIEGQVNSFELAKQCGTSVTIIEKYYAAIDVKNMPERFMFNNALTGVYEGEEDYERFLR